MSTTTYYAIALGLILLVSLSAFVTPVRIALKAVLRTVGGFAALTLLNFLGGFIGLFVGVNLANSLLVALLGPIGLVLVLLLQWSLT